MSENTDTGIQIRISCPSLPDEEAKYLAESIRRMLEILVSRGINLQTVGLIAITEFFKEEVEETKKELGISFNLTNEKEFFAVAKNIRPRNLQAAKVRIFIDFVRCRNAPLLEIVLKQLFSHLAEVNIFDPSSIDDEVFLSDSVPILMAKLSREWLPRSLSRKYLEAIGIKEALASNDLKSYTDYFRRKVKRSHWDYQSHTDISKFWGEYLNAFSTFILRCIEAVNVKNAESELEEFYHEVVSIVDEISRIADDAKPGFKFDTTVLEDKFHKIAERCYVQVTYDQALRVTITENPKSIFAEKTLDTEQRIVGFVDILGFSEAIAEYDRDPQSNLLRHIRDALNTAVQFSLEFAKNFSSRKTNRFEYRLFSDCLCLSNPFFENKNDFLLEFVSLITTVSSYQLTLMGQELFVRGGISIGSYYADNTMILSGGLVKSAALEKDAIYPRVVLDNEIVNRLKGYSIEELNELGVSKAILLDTEGKAFLDPIGSIKMYEPLMKYTLRNMEANEKEVEEDPEISDDIKEMLRIVNENTKRLLLDMTERFGIPRDSQQLSGVIKGIREKIDEAINVHNNNEKVLKKYVWLKTLIDWEESGNSKNNRFQYLFGS